MNPGPEHSPEEVNRRLVDRYTEIARLTGALAHEIKNPLSTIRLNMELLAEEFADDDSPRERRARAKIAVVQHECQRLQNLLDDFLSFSKVRSLHLEPTDLNDEIRSALEFFRPQAEESRIEISPFLEADLPLVQLDREAFRGAILNLLLNAQQAMPDGGHLVVATQTTPRSVALALIDRGPGMDEQTRSRIFDAFYSTKRGGSGLGLPTTRKIIEAHGGTIDVQSELGKGTMFTIQLPLPARLQAN